MNLKEKEVDSQKELPFLRVHKQKNQIICGYPQLSFSSINSLCANQYFGIIHIVGLKRGEAYQNKCCVLISPIHVITTLNQLVDDERQLIYSKDQIQIIFSNGQHITKVTSYFQLDRFLILTLKDNLGINKGYIGLVASEQQNEQKCSEIDKQTPYICGVNVEGNQTYFQCIIYRENLLQYELPNNGNIRLQEGSGMLKNDDLFGLCLLGLVSLSDDKQRIVIEKIQLKDILIIQEIILTGGIITSEKKIDINMLYALDQKTFLNSNSKIYCKSLDFEKNIEILGEVKCIQIQLIDMKIINSELLSAISKSGDLYIINIQKNTIEQIIPLNETPSLLQVHHDELIIGINKKLLFLNYLQMYSTTCTYSFESQILSLLLIEASSSKSQRHTQYLVGCYNGLYIIDAVNKTQQKIEIPQINLKIILTMQYNQELNQKSSLNSYNVYNNQSSIILNSAEKILIIDWKQLLVKKNFIGHQKNVYFIEQIRVNLLISGSSDCSLILWDKQSGSQLKQIQLSNPIYHGFLLNQQELITIDYNTVRIFNTITFKYTKYQYHQKPITCSSIVNNNIFVTCDTSNQIILWKADTFLIQSYMNNQFNICRTQENCNIKDQNIKYSENEQDFIYIPHDLKGPKLIKYQLQLDDSKRVQEKLRNALEDQICQNIQERLTSKNIIKQLENFITQKNKEVQKLNQKLYSKKEQITSTVYDMQSKTEELQNYATFQSQSKHHNLKSSSMINQCIQTEFNQKKDNQFGNNSESTSNQNLLTPKKQSYISYQSCLETKRKDEYQNQSECQCNKQNDLQNLILNQRKDENTVETNQNRIQELNRINQNQTSQNSNPNGMDQFLHNLIITNDNSKQNNKLMQEQNFTPTDKQKQNFEAISLDGHSNQNYQTNLSPILKNPINSHNQSEIIFTESNILKDCKQGQNNQYSDQQCTQPNQNPQQIKDFSSLENENNLSNELQFQQSVILKKSQDISQDLQNIHISSTLSEQNSTKINQKQIQKEIVNNQIPTKQQQEKQDEIQDQIQKEQENDNTLKSSLNKSQKIQQDKKLSINFDLKTSQQLIRSLKKMESMEDILQKSDPLLQQLCSLIINNK